MALPEDRKADLEDFLDRARMVEGTKLVASLRATDSTQLKFEFSSNQLKVTSHRADDAELHEFLLAFRPFTLKREGIELGRTFDLLEERLASDRLREGVRRIRRDWEIAQKGAVPFLFNSEEMTAFGYSTWR